ncbi:MAG: DUF1223 domain-containing protein, partial [Gemmatimonadota bacterium]
MSLSTVLAAALAATCSVTSPPHTVALVELYTSQGCSSCPPADRWLSKLGPADRVIPLALHVGYWDYIGWKDPFARREFNERQRRLADLNGSRTVYTPGVFVQGRETPRWSDARAFAAAVNAINALPAPARIDLTAGIAHGRIEARAAVAATGVKRPQVMLALVQDGNVTRVSAGENRGETLVDDHVVTEWSGWLAPDVAVQRWNLPDVPTERLSVVAAVQDGSGRLLQSVALPLAACV